MTTRERRELEERLHREAESQLLKITKRERAGSKWVWDVHMRGGTLAARGMNLQSSRTTSTLTATPRSRIRHEAAV